MLYISFIISPYFKIKNNVNFYSQYLSGLSTNSRKILIFGILFGYVAVLYLPLILNGGIVVDDWGDIGQDLNCTNFLDCYLGWFPLFANRPLAPIPIVSSTMLLGLNFSGYLALNAGLYLISLGLLSRVINRWLEEFSVLGFFALASIPIIAMPILVSPINCSVNNFSLLLWAISLLSLIKYCESGRLLFYFLSYLFLLLCLLTYEIILPMIILNACLPYFLIKSNKRPKWLYVMKYLLPMLGIVGIILLWQKIIAPEIFSVVYSRITFSWQRTYWGLDGWLSIFYEKMPNLYIKLWSLYKAEVLISVSAIALIFFSIKSLINTKATKPTSTAAFLLIVCLVFFSCYVIFSLGGAKGIEIGDYGSRILSSTWLAFSLLLASLLNVSRGFLKKLILILFLFITSFSATAFIIQRNNYISSWQLQQRIIENVMNLVRVNNIKTPINIIGDVPQYLDSNFNNEVVFSAPWDFGYALYIYSDGLISGGAPIDVGRELFHSIQLNGAGVILDDFWKAAPPNLWVYSFNVKNETGTLVHISNQEKLNNWLHSIGYLGELGISSSIERNQPIDFGKRWINRSKFVGAGWYPEIESWGGVWSIKENAEIILPMPSSGASSIEVTGKAFVMPSHPVQRVEILFNGKYQKTVSLAAADGNKFLVPIPESLRMEKALKIGFHFLDSASPKSVGLSEDSRGLAFGLQKITFIH